MSLDGTPYSEDIVDLTKQPTMPRRQTLLIDFDGVLHDYKGWNGPEAVNGPINKARAAMHSLASTYNLVCFSTRDKVVIERWLRHYGFPEMRVTNHKEPAFLIIDDRAITFTGEWNDELLKKIQSFKTHWEVAATSSDHLPSPAAPQVDRP